MVLKIRLARFGKRNAPFYNIVVAQARTARNSKPLEVLGSSPQFPVSTAYSTLFSYQRPLLIQFFYHWQCLRHL